MTTLRDEIDRRLASNQNYYAHFVTFKDMQNIRKETTDDILKLIEKRIDSVMQREINESHHFEIQQRKNDLNPTDGIVRICRELKELLK